MKKILFMILGMSLIGVCQCQISDPSIQDIDKIFDNTNGQSPGYIIAVINKDKTIFSKGYGLANLENGISINDRTSFNIASLSKQITAAAVAFLILEKKVELDDLVSDYLDSFPFDKDSVRIKHLIYMTSGINDYRYNDRTNGTDWSSLNYFNIDTAIQASYSSSELMYESGSQWSYSNINYMLLTKIVEAVSGISFSAFVKQRIFEPLGMTSSIINDDIFEVIPNRAYGYNIRTDDETSWLIESGYLENKAKGTCRYIEIHHTMEVVVFTLQ